MKALRLLTIFTLLFSCNNNNDDPLIVTSLDQIAGIWKWESSCGGFAGTCSYPNSLHYGELQFTTNAKFIETHNDTVYLAANYEIIESDNNCGTLVLHKAESDAILSQTSICILDNELVISMGEFFSTYKKIK